MPALSQLPSRMHDNPVRAIFARAAATPGCIRLEVGEPDFRTPQHICQAAEKAIRDGWHYYTPMGGLPSLKERLVAKLARVNQVSANVDQIVVGNGATGVLSGAMVSLAEAGDEILIPDPSWGGYPSMAAIAGVKVVRYPCPAENGYLPDMDRLTALITPRSKLLVINSPSNPTGVIYPRETLQEIGELAARYGLWILSDEAYDQIVLDSPQAAPSMLTCADPSRVVAAFSFGKSYAMTGWRISYGCGPSEAIKVSTKACDAMYSCVNALGQQAAIAALDGPQECIAEMVAEYRRRRDVAGQLLSDAKLLLTLPTGAFYAMADISSSGLSSLDFAWQFLEERKVAMAPGSGFGPGGEGAIRISLANSEENIRQGISQLIELTAR